MQQIGPYRIEHPLGEGGMGVVWRATHTDTGQPVALKTVRMLHTRQLDGLRREIRALSRIAHPGIVRILDQGVHEGAPWYAMEILEGPSLRQRARTLTSSATTRFLDSDPGRDRPGTTLDIDADPLAPPVHDVPPPPEERPMAGGGKLLDLLGVVRGLCDPLAFLHGEGIVHRDLKPENVVVTDAGRPVLVDFGLVAQGAAGRETLSVDAMLHGTVSYMSPEQIRGELVDARADLYALGVILYELVTGRLPFVGNSVGATLYQALERPPLPPSEQAVGVPAELDALILALLAKRREDRPGYATDVSEVLRSLGATRADTSPPPARAYLYRPGFSGRQSALEALNHGLQLRRGVVLLGGEPGVGKTRTAVEFGREATSRGRRVLVGACQPVSGDGRGGALHPLRPALQALADACMQGGLTDALIGDRGRLLARYQPALLDVPGVADLPPLERLDPEAERNRTLAWLTRSLVALGAPTGAVLLLDDLQWADQLTLDWLAHVARSDPEGLLVVCTWSVDERTAALEALLRAPGLSQVELRALGRSDVAAIASDMLALPNPPAGLVDFLVRASDGNPFLVAEYLRAAVVEGVLVRREHRWRIAADPDDDAEAWADLPVDRRLEDLVLSRVQRLGSLAGAVLEAAAVAGGDVELDRIARIARPDLDPADPDWLDALSELLEAHVLEAEEDRLRFVHDRVREVVYDDLEDLRRASLHGAVAAVLEATGTARPGTLGTHWLRAGDPTRAGLWLLRAAQESLDQVAHADAEQLLRRYLSLDGMPEPDRIRARIDLGGRVLATLGRYAEALEVLEEARRDARLLGATELLADAIAALGDVAATVGRLADALALHREELDLRRSLSDHAGTARAMLRVASGVAAHGNPTHAAPLAAEALDLARRAGDPVLEGEALLAQATLGADDREQARRLLESAKTAFDAAGVRLQQARALERMADQADGPTALSLYEQALALYRAIGERVRTGRVLGQVGRTLHELGRTEEAHAAGAEALAVFRETGHHRFQGHTLHALGTQLRREGRLAEAAALNRQALTLLTVVGDRPLLVRTRLELALVALLRRDLEAARSHAERAERMATQLDRPDPRVEALHLLGVACDELDDLAGALAVHRQAGELAESAQRSELAARALVWAARAERRSGTGTDEDHGATLEAALGSLRHHRCHAARATAWCELGHLALARGESADEALDRARAAWAEPRYRDGLVARHLEALDEASGRS